jgi:hypothetical protein
MTTGHPGGAAVDLFWLPLGAGTPVVRACGRGYERLHAWRDGRRPAALYHVALQLAGPPGRFTVELTPVPRGPRSDRGVVAQGPVGSRLLGRFRPFRYEVRCWRDGRIPDAAEAVGGPHRLTDDPAAVQHMLRRVGSVPTLVWGRDELRAGEMWNSNSVISWLLTSSGIPAAELAPPGGGRAPGWAAGVVAARRGPPPELSSTSSRSAPS